MSKVYFLAGDKACVLPPLGNGMCLDPLVNGNLPRISSITDGDTLTITMNLTNSDSRKTNVKYYEDFTGYIIDNKVTELTALSGKFKMFVDAVIYDASGKIIDEGIRIHNIDSDDGIRILPIVAGNECSYVRVKMFNTTIQYTYNRIVSGIVSNAKVPRYMRIRGLSIMAEKGTPNPNGVCILNSTLIDQTLSPISPSIQKATEEMVEIFNSYGTDLGVIDMLRAPRSVDLCINLSIEGFVDVYDSTEIDSLITLNGGTTPTPPPVPTTPCNPDDCGCSNFFAVYVYCDSDDPKAGVIVSDDDYTNNNYTGLAYKLSDVLKDIPTAKVGEYVRYDQSIVFSSL